MLTEKKRKVTKDITNHQKDCVGTEIPETIPETPETIPEVQPVTIPVTLPKEMY